MIRSTMSLCRRGYTCLFVNFTKRQNMRYESTSTVEKFESLIKKVPGGTSNLEEAKSQSPGSVDSEIISKGIFPTKESMDVLVNGIPYKEIPIVHIKAGNNNTIMILVDKDDKVLGYSSGGTVGFKNAKKGTNMAAQTIAYDIAQKALFKEVNIVRVCVQGIGPGRLSGIKGLQSGGLNVISITDTTKLPHNGSRPKKAPRK